MWRSWSPHRPGRPDGRGAAGLLADRTLERIGCEGRWGRRAVRSSEQSSGSGRRRVTGSPPLTPWDVTRRTLTRGAALLLGGGAVLAADLPRRGHEPSNSRSWLAGYAGSGDRVTRARWATQYFPAQVWTSFQDYETSWSQRTASITRKSMVASAEYLRPVSDGSAVNVITVGLLLSGSGGSQAPNPSALRAAAAGADVGNWAQVANALVAAGLDSPSTVLRIGHEPNGSWYPWSTANNPVEMSFYRQAWRHAHDAVTRVCPRVRYNLSFTVGLGGAAAIAGHYPGDDYVDIMGLDFYDYAGSTTTDQFQSAQGTCGFADIAVFARAHGKHVSLDEWGPSTRADIKVRDNPFYVRSIFHALLRLQDQYADTVLYDSYFNSSNNHNLDVNPRCSAEYRLLWVV